MSQSDAEKALVSEETLEALKAKHGNRLHQWIFEDDEGDEQAIVFRKASKAVWGRYVDSLASDAPRFATSQALVEGCVVFPEIKELRTLVDAEPSLVSAIERQISAVMGKGKKREAVKL